MVMVTLGWTVFTSLLANELWVQLPDVFCCDNKKHLLLSEQNKQQTTGSKTATHRTSKVYLAHYSHLTPCHGKILTLGDILGETLLSNPNPET